MGKLLTPSRLVAAHGLGGARWTEWTIRRKAGRACLSRQVFFAHIPQREYSAVISWKVELRMGLG